MTGALILIAAFFASPAGAMEVPVCPVPADAQARSFPGEIPQPLLADLKKRYGEIAAPGEEFSESDAMAKPLPMRRIAFVWQRGNRWVFGTQRGGIGTSTPVVTYDLDAVDAKIAFFKEEEGQKACETARRWIAAQN